MKIFQILKNILTFKNKMQSVLRVWEKSDYSEPEIKFLICNQKIYAVIEDSFPIIIVMSKTNVIYAISKSKLYLNKDKYYFLESPRDMRVISCSENSIKDIRQKFVMTEIIPIIKKLSFENNEIVF